MTDVVALAAELLAIDSSTGAESAAIDFVSRWLIARGWNVTVQSVSPGRGNIWASRAGKGVTFSTHLDTVPPHVAPRMDGDRLYGRGACDAKGIAAAMLAAADRLVAAGENRVDLSKLIERVKAILTAPKTTWPVIAEEPATIGDIYKNYVVVLAALAALLTLVAYSMVGIHVPFLGAVFYTVVSVALTTGAYLLLYMTVPNRDVDWRDAVWGGLVAAIAFEGQMVDEPLAARARAVLAAAVG